MKYTARFGSTLVLVPRCAACASSHRKEGRIRGGVIGAVAGALLSYPFVILPAQAISRLRIEIATKAAPLADVGVPWQAIPISLLFVIGLGCLGFFTAHLRSAKRRAKNADAYDCVNEMIRQGWYVGTPDPRWDSEAPKVTGLNLK